MDLAVRLRAELAPHVQQPIERQFAFARRSLQNLRKYVRRRFGRRRRSQAQADQRRTKEAEVGDRYSITHQPRTHCRRSLHTGR